MLEARPPSVSAAGEQPQAAPSTPVQPEAAADGLGADVARAVRDLRVAAGLSERAAARLLGTSQTQLRRMEDPRYLPSLRSLARLAAAYGHRIAIVFEPKDKPAARQPRTPRAKATRPKRAAVARQRGGRAKKRG